MQLSSLQIDVYKYARVISKLLELTQKNFLIWRRAGIIPVSDNLIIYGDMYEAVYAGTKVFLSAPNVGHGSDALVSIVFTDMQSERTYSLQGLSGLSSLYRAVYEQANPQAGLENILDRIITS
ncbi:MAG: hypothetical protein MUF71_04215 [Candidatus Kapabacteria bacterium]|jgi:hypothetical protein|nr:hypothetical protein [Candidatus Kapabacteria bacterium]